MFPDKSSPLVPAENFTSKFKHSSSLKDLVLV